jgi:chromosome segregation ATPase
MSSSVALYEALTTAPDDRTRARVIAEAFERLEERYPHLPDLATQSHVRESELRLQKDIEQVRAELRATELRLHGEIEQVRAELKIDIEHLRAELKADIEHLRAELKADIEQIRADLHATELRLQKEIAHIKLDLLKWLVPLMFAQVAAIAALVKLL